MKRFLLSLVMFFICISLSRAQNPNLGSAGAQFLKIPIGGQAAGLGGAVTGMLSDATAIFWNPAGIAGVNSNSAHFSYMRWFDMFDVNAAAFVHNFEKIGYVGIGLLVFRVPEMEITDEYNQQGTGRYYDAQDFALTLGYARYLTDAFKFGLSFKYINQRIWNETANGIAFDVGTQYRIEFQNLIIAMSMTNFGPDMNMTGADLNISYDRDQNLKDRLVPSRYQTEDYPLPLNFQFGLCFDIYNSRFLTVRGAVDAVHPSDNDERIQLGGEFKILDMLLLRGGYKFKHDVEKMNFGAGFKIFLGSFVTKLDYAYVVNDILPDVHYLSFGLDF